MTSRVAIAIVLSSICCHAFAPGTTIGRPNNNGPNLWHRAVSLQQSAEPQNRKVALKTSSLEASVGSSSDGKRANNIKIKSSKTGPLLFSSVSTETIVDAFTAPESFAPLPIPSVPNTDQQQIIPANASSSTPQSSSSPSSLVEGIMSTYAGPRLVLAAVACLYGTNFPLGSLMADAMPAASAATSARMVLAALALSPFLPRIDPKLRIPAVLAGSFTSLGYVAQSLALVDTPPATVSFLGAATVLVCPFLEWALDGRPMSPRDAPQTWLAAALCLSGVAVLELMDPAAAGGASFGMGMGDALALLQAVGFGTGCYLSERMMRKGGPDQALPVTATIVATTAFASMVWSLADGWMAQPGGLSYALPNLFLDPSLGGVAAAVAWTGIVSTSMNFGIEISALGRVPSAEASVILATEPLWAALFGAFLLHEQFGMNDYVGGLLVVLACLANTLNPSDIHGWFGLKADGKKEGGAS